MSTTVNLPKEAWARECLLEARALVEHLERGSVDLETIRTHAAALLRCSYSAPTVDYTYTVGPGILRELT